MPTTLKNRTKQSRTYILHAGPHVAELLPVRRQQVAVERFDPETGARSVELKARRLPESISLMPKGTPGSPDPSVLEGLPNSVLHCPDVQRDIRAGFLDVVTLPDAEPVAPAPPPPPPPPASAQEPSPPPIDTLSSNDASGKKSRKES